MSEKKLAPNVRRFIAEYLIDRNATQAAIRAGYSQKSASSQASRMLRNVNILRAIQTAEDEELEKLAINKSTLIRKAWDGFLVNSQMVSKETVNNEGDVIRSVEEMRDSTAAVKFFEQVSKLTGIAEDKQKITEEVVYKWG